MCKFNYPGVSRRVAITVKLRVLASAPSLTIYLTLLLLLLHKFELKLIQYGAIIVKQNGLNNKIHSAT